MKKLYFLLFTLLTSSTFFAQTVFINEIHYDNDGGDVNEGIEIAGPAGTDLSTYTLTPYNGSNGASYTPITALSGTITDESGTGYGTIFFPIAGLQNGAPDGIALDNGGVLIQFLSYEGSFTATAGVANGVTSTDIGVTQPGTTPVGESLQLTGTGNSYADFTWTANSASSYNAINTGQTFPSLSLENTTLFKFSVYPNPTSTGYVNITSTNNDAMSVAVFDVLGKQVINKTISNNRLDVSSLNSGLYIVKISQNNATTTKKLVIK
jgi:hypothetical protein